MLSLQIIWTYKSRLNYGHQKNSWKVSINCKTPLVGIARPAGECQPRENMETGILVTLWVGDWYVSRDRATRILARRSGSLGELRSNWWVPLISRDANSHQCEACHPSTWGPLQTSSACWSEEDLGGIRLPLSGFCLRSERATEPLTSHLAEAPTLEKSWQSIHFAPSRSQLMSDWWDPPSLMLYSSESTLLGEKCCPSKWKRNISASSC